MNGKAGFYVEITKTDIFTKGFGGLDGALRFDTVFIERKRYAKRLYSAVTYSS